MNRDIRIELTFRKRAPSLMISYVDLTDEDNEGPKEPEQEVVTLTKVVGMHSVGDVTEELSREGWTLVRWKFFDGELQSAYSTLVESLEVEVEDPTGRAAAEHERDSERKTKGE